MQNIEKANLILLTNDLTVGEENERGFKSLDYTQMTWRNINLRALLGAMYDKYETFNLCINSIQSSYTTSNPTSNAERSCYVTIAGLPFINNSYNVRLKSNTGTAILCNYTLPNLNEISYSVYQNEILTFSKHQETASITLEFRTVTSNNLPIPLGAYPAFSFQFSIYGVEKVQNQRM